MPTISALRQRDVADREQTNSPRRFKVFTQRDLDRIEQLQAMPEAVRFEMKVVASVLPFRVNAYVISSSIT